MMLRKDVLVTVPDSLLNLNGDMMAAVDVETTGSIAGWHEIVQVAVLPLNSEIEPSTVHRPFYLHLKPEHPERAQHKAMEVNGLDLEWLEANGIDRWRAADLFDEWFQALDLPFKKRLCPLAHNWAFERGFLLDWLGLETLDAIWHPHSRDSQRVATLFNDAAAYHGKKIPFGTVSQRSLCKKFGIVNANEHDALADCLACSKLYRALVRGLGHSK